MRLVVLAITVALSTLTSSSPALAHPVSGRAYVYVDVTNDCVLTDGYTDHSYWEARTSSRSAYYHGSSRDPCGQYNYTGANQLRIEPVHYKNGDGRGGYEVRFDWGMYYSACCYTTWTVYGTVPLSNYWGPGYYTQDNYSLAYVRQLDDYRGGWAPAVWGDWLGY